MTLLLLWLLATLDAAFIGYREAAGRSALIRKRDHYRSAMLRGALVGQIVVIVVGLLILTAIQSSSDPGAVAQEMLTAGSKMLLVYVPYAVVILITFAVRSVPSVDLRSITSVVVFGPLTFVRPVVATAGVAWGIYTAPTLANLLLGFVILALMLTLETALGFLRAKRLFA